jgi:hypothetical protein
MSMRTDCFGRPARIEANEATTFGRVTAVHREPGQMKRLELRVWRKILGKIPEFPLIANESFGKSLGLSHDAAESRMITLNDYVARMSTIFERPVGPLNEIKRALTEQTKTFSYDAMLEELFGEDESTIAAVRQASFNSEMLQGKAGPGGGVVADPFRAGFFTIAAAMDGPRSTTAEMTWRVWHLPQEGSVLSGWGDFRPTIAKCELTNHHLFGGAFETIIADPVVARRVKQVRFACDSSYAEIFYDDKQVSRFVHEHRRGRNFARRVAEIEGVAIQMISNLLGKQ